MPGCPASRSPTPSSAGSAIGPSPKLSGTDSGEVRYERIAEKTNWPKSEAQRYFNAFEEVVTDVLKGGDEVQITGFGKFCVRDQKAREGSNPKSGDKTRIAAQRVPTFGAGNSLKESV